MLYTLKVVTPFTDTYDETKHYTKNEEIIVTEERALELFSSDYHLVKFISRNSKPISKTVDNKTDNKKKK